MNYVTDLEKQNEELQRKLSNLQRIEEHKTDKDVWKCEAVFSIQPHSDCEREVLPAGMLIPAMYVLHEINCLSELDYSYFMKKLKALQSVYDVRSLTFNMNKNGHWAWTLDIRFNDDKTWNVYVGTYISSSDASRRDVKPSRKTLSHFLEKIRKLDYSIFL